MPFEPTKTLVGKGIRPIINLRHSSPELLFWSRWTKRTNKEPGTPGKWLLKRSWLWFGRRKDICCVKDLLLEVLFRGI